MIHAQSAAQSRVLTGGKSRARVTCDGPDCTTETMQPVQYAKKAPFGPEEGQIMRRLMQQGWSVVRNKLYCPDCTAARKSPTEKDASVSNVTTMKPTTDGLRRPDLAMRRLILDMLHAAYDTAAQRYSGSETDKTVADAIGPNCLPGWVAEIREEFFGPDGGNVAMDELRAEIADALAKLTAAETAAAENLARAQSALDALRKANAAAQKDLEALASKLDGVRKAVGPKAGVRA